MSQCSTDSASKWSKSFGNTLSGNSSRLIVGISVVLSAMFVMPTAQAASCKLPKSYYKNVSCIPNSRYFLAIKDFGAPVALIDSRGKAVVDLSSYQKVDVSKIADGIFPVQRNGRIGYVDMQGREVIPTVYDILSGGQGWARPVSEGRVVVKKSGQYGVVSTSNQTIVPFSSAISDIDNYRSGVARVRKNKAISWLDGNGNAAADPNAKVVSRNDSNSAARNTASNASRNNNTGSNSTQNNSARSDNIRAATTSNSQVYSNNNPIPNNNALISVPPSRPAGFSTLQPDQKDGMWGFVDEQQVIMITYSFEEARPFSEGLAGVRVADKWGFLNLGGELVIPFNFEAGAIMDSNSDANAPSFVFKNGKAWVSSLKNGGKICINKAGAYVSCI